MWYVALPPDYDGNMCLEDRTKPFMAKDARCCTLCRVLSDAGCLQIISETECPSGEGVEAIWNGVKPDETCRKR